MRKFHKFVLGTGALSLAVFATPSFAGKVCMVDHYHHGSGSGSTEDRAERAAIRSWASFTSFEYGGAWADWGDSKNQRVSCRDSGGKVSCSVDAIPCRYR